MYDAEVGGKNAGLTVIPSDIFQPSSILDALGSHDGEIMIGTVTHMPIDHLIDEHGSIQRREGEIVDIAALRASVYRWKSIRRVGISRDIGTENKVDLFFHVVNDEERSSERPAHGQLSCYISGPRILIITITALDSRGKTSRSILQTEWRGAEFATIS